MTDEKRRDPLSEGQQRVFDYIRDHTRLHGYPPTLREIGRQLGFRSTNGVSEHLWRLEKKGYITRSALLSRGIQIVGDAVQRTAEEALAEATARAVRAEEQCNYLSAQLAAEVRHAQRLSAILRKNGLSV